MKQLSVSVGLFVTFVFSSLVAVAEQPFNIQIKSDSVSCSSLIGDPITEADYRAALKNLIAESDTLPGQYKLLNNAEAHGRMPTLRKLNGFHWMYRQTSSGTKIVVSTEYRPPSSDAGVVGFYVHFLGPEDEEFLAKLKQNMVDRFDYVLNGGLYTRSRPNEINVEDFLRHMNVADYMDSQVGDRTTWHFELDPLIFHYMDRSMQLHQADLAPEFHSEILEGIVELTQALPLQAESPRRPRARLTNPVSRAAEAPVGRPQAAATEAPVDITDRSPNPGLSGKELQQYELLRQAIIEGMRNGLKQRSETEADRLRRSRIRFPMGNGGV